MAEQLNVFIENRKGRLGAVARVLADHNINIRAIEIQDRGEFGLVKLIVDDPGRAQKALAEARLACALKPVLAIAIEDQPGGLFRLMQTLGEKGVNVLNAYGFVIESRREAVCCIEVEDAARATAALEGSGFRILADRELYGL